MSLASRRQRAAALRGLWKTFCEQQRDCASRRMVCSVLVHPNGNAAGMQSRPGGQGQLPSSPISRSEKVDPAPVVSCFGGDNLLGDALTLSTANSPLARSFPRLTNRSRAG